MGFHLSEDEFKGIEEVLAQKLTVSATGSGGSLDNLKGA